MPTVDSNYEHFYYFDFTKELNGSSKLKCADCGKWVPVLDWVHIDNYCDICGDHPAIMCPECDNVLDYVWDDETIEVLNE